MSQARSVHLVVTGTVQGVFFRKWTQERARAHGLTGWVRNRDDGAVEAIASGPGPAIDALVAECRVGPPAARVSDVTVSETESVDADDFEIVD